MNARAYFTILRPVRTLLLTGFYGWSFGLTLFKTLGGAAQPEALFLSTAVLGAWLLGAYLVGPLHEVMHRNFFLLLPGARRSLRRWHAGAIGVTAVLLFVGTEFSRFAYPRPATIGLILLGLTVPLLNRRRPTPRAFYVKACLLLGAGAFLCLPTRSLLVEAGRQFPWLVFACGTAGAWINFRLGFAAKSVCERSRRPQVVACAQTIVPIPGAGWAEMLRYTQTENARLLLSKRPPKSGRDWRVANVGRSRRAWVAAIHHARWGASPPLTQPLLFLILGVMPPAVVAAIPLVFGNVAGGHTAVSALAGQIAAGGRLTAPPGRPADFAFLMYPVFGLSVTVLACIAIGGPSFRPPLSRGRLAECVGIGILRLAALTLAGYAAGVFGSMVLALALAGRSPAVADFGRPLACVLVVPPLALLELTFLYRTAQLRWLPPLGTFGLSIVAAIFAAVFALQLAERLVSPFGLLAWLPLTGLLAWGCWRALHRYYQTCDLSQPSPWTKHLTEGA